MKRLIKGTNTITLDQTGIASGQTINLVLINSAGQPVKGSSGTPIPVQTLSYNSEKQKYECSVTIGDTEPLGYIRAYFYSATVVIQDSFYPEDYELATMNPVEFTAEVVPVQYMLDFVLNDNYMFDPLMKTTLLSFANNNKAGLREYLKQATSLLETSTRLYFAERTISDEKQDYFYDNYKDHLFLFNVRYPPLNEVTRYELKIGESTIMDIPEEYLSIDRLLGTIEFIPLASNLSTASLYVQLQNVFSSYVFSVMGGRAVNRIPALFRVTYKTGLIYPGSEPTEASSIRMAICKKAVEQMILFDPAFRAGSISESIDGESTSISYQSQQLIKTLQDQEAAFTQGLQTKYGKSLEAVVV